MKLRLPPLQRLRRMPLDDRRVAASELFDASYHLINGADVAAAGAEPLRHFCDHGWREGRRPNLFFDPRWYASRYLGVAGAQVNPLVDYIERGERAGFRPIPFFDPAWYRSAYGLGRRISPLANYLANRRAQKFAPNPLFDLAFYLARHGDEIGTADHMCRCAAPPARPGAVSISKMKFAPCGRTPTPNV